MGTTLLFLMTVSMLAEAGLVYRTPTRSARAYSIPDEFKTTTDYIESTGAVAENHEVTTEDGYIITLHRLPAEDFDEKRVAIIQHGIAGSSDNWLIYKERSLPIMLARRGWDVWMPNSRGSTYSRKHVNLTTDDARYWRFRCSHGNPASKGNCLHEQGYYDLAASIDYVLNYTEAKSLFLIAHSRGTSSAFALLSTRPEYNEKVRLMLCFAPVAYIKNAKSPLLQPFFKMVSARQAKKIAQRGNIFSFAGVGADNKTRELRKVLCNIRIGVRICRRLHDMFNGAESLNNEDVMEIMANHFPDGFSMRELLHYLQLAQRDEFAQYDFGSVSKNLAVYNSTEPPSYPIENITVPMSFHVADNDNIVSTKDLMRLVKRIRNNIGVFRVPYSKFNHLNFIFGEKSDDYVYKPAIELMESWVDKSR